MPKLLCPEECRERIQGNYKETSQKRNIGYKPEQGGVHKESPKRPWHSRYTIVYALLAKHICNASQIRPVIDIDLGILLPFHFAGHISLLQCTPRMPASLTGV